MDVLWQPEPGWLVAPGGAGGARLWWAERDGREVVVKRLDAPVPGDPAALSRPAHPAYWRREAEVALDGALATTAGIRAAEVLAVEEDAAGVTLVVERVDPARPVQVAGGSGLAIARALGVFAGNDLTASPWWSRRQLGVRLEQVAERGGWPTLARTTLADVADRLWQRRRHHLAALEALPQVPSHGDPTAANLPGRDGERLVGIDWSGFGSAAVGADVGYLALSVRESLDVLLEAYVEGLATARSPADVDEARRQARLGATVMATYSALTRTEWALARVAAGPGALAGKYRHPSVAPYIRSLQRLLPEVESLL